MFLFKNIDLIDDILLYNNNIYLCKQNKIKSSDIETMLDINMSIKESYIIDSSIDNYKLPCLKKVFFILTMNLNRIPTVDELADKYIETFFVQNKDYTLSIIDFSIKKPKRFSYIGIKNSILNRYIYFLKYYHLYLKCSESNLFDKVIYSYQKEDDIVIVKDNKYFSVNIDTKDSFLNKYRKNKNKNIVTLPNDTIWTSKYGEIYLFNESAIKYINQKVSEYDIIIKEKNK